MSPQRQPNEYEDGNCSSIESRCPVILWRTGHKAWMKGF